MTSRGNFSIEQLGKILIVLKNVQRARVDLVVSAGRELQLGGTWPRLCPGGWRLLVDVLPRLELGQSDQSGQAGGGQAAPAGPDLLEERLASGGQQWPAKCGPDTGSLHHGRVNYSASCYFSVISLFLLLLNNKY